MTLITDAFPAALSYVTLDGNVYSGDTPFQVVDAIRADSFMTEAKDLDTYMHGAALRFSVTNKVIIRVDSPENFLHDLEAGGILKRVRP